MLYLPKFKESEHTHRSSFTDITDVVPSLDSKRVSILTEAVLLTLPMLYLPLIQREGEHTQKSLRRPCEVPMVLPEPRSHLAIVEKTNCPILVLPEPKSHLVTVEIRVAQ